MLHAFEKRARSRLRWELARKRLAAVVKLAVHRRRSHVHQNPSFLRERLWRSWFRARGAQPTSTPRRPRQGIKARRLTQARAAALFGVTQPRAGATSSAVRSIALAWTPWWPKHGHQGVHAKAIDLTAEEVAPPRGCVTPKSAAALACVSRRALITLPRAIIRSARSLRLADLLGREPKIAKDVPGGTTDFGGHATSYCERRAWTTAASRFRASSQRSLRSLPGPLLEGVEHVRCASWQTWPHRRPGAPRQNELVDLCDAPDRRSPWASNRLAGAHSWEASKLIARLRRRADSGKARRSSSELPTQRSGLSAIVQYISTYIFCARVA